MTKVVKSSKRLLIISSYGIPCGIAQYAEHLVPVLQRESGENYEIDIAALDVRLLKTGTRFAKKLAKQHLNEIANRAKAADIVNIQLEPGLFGSSPFEIKRRLKLLLRASRRVIITHHTILDLRDTSWNLPLSRKQLYQLARNLSMVYVLGWLYRYSRANTEKLFHIVQTRLDQGAFIMLGMPSDRVVASPLAFIDQNQRSSPDFIGNDPLSYLPLSDDAIVIGVFGFLSPYKGFEVIIRAMDLLPTNYHLLVVGGLHPEGIVQHSTKQPYISELLSEIEPKGKRVNLATALRFAKERLKRIHFIGHLGNDEFVHYMRACDTIVLPYAEVGQRSSGPASMAIDLDKRILCSRNICFSQLNTYAGAVELFEIGNHAELAQKLQNKDHCQEQRQQHRSKYSLECRARLYLDAADKLLEALPA